ncbi:hypothetical protein PENSPDRAFT_694896 [Peniophora sp. CONT]|nr:hypothetical protein PENSPDRAFT_694896 [Peniophora sp. CONT]
MRGIYLQLVALGWICFYALFSSSFHSVLAADDGAPDPNARPTLSWHDLVPQPPDADNRPRVVTWQTRAELDSEWEHRFIAWLVTVDEIARGITDYDWSTRYPMRVPRMPGVANWTYSDESPIGTWGVFGREEPFPPADPGPPPFSSRTQPTFRSVYPGSAAGSVWPPPVWYRRDRPWVAWFTVRPEGSRALLWYYERDDQLIEIVEGGFVLSPVAALAFNSIADDVEAMSSAIHGALGLLPPPEPIPRYTPGPDAVRSLEALVAYIDDVRWLALNHIAYVRMMLGPISPLGIRGFGPPGWNYPSAPGRPFADALEAYHVRGGTHVGTLLDTRALPDQWPSMQVLANAEIPFWWLQGREEPQHEREQALRFRNFNNCHLPALSAERAAKADSRRRKRERESAEPYRGYTRAFMLQDRGPTRSRFNEHVRSENPRVREDMTGMSSAALPIAAAARALWIRRYEFVRGFPRSNDIAFLGWRRLTNRRDVERGREADPSTWTQVVPRPREDDSGDEVFSEDDDYDSDNAVDIGFSDIRRWPPAPQGVFPARPERPPVRTSFASTFPAAADDWARRFRAEASEPMDVDPPPRTPSPPNTVASAVVEDRPVEAPAPSPIAPLVEEPAPHTVERVAPSPPTMPQPPRVSPVPQLALRITEPSSSKGKGKGKARASDDDDDDVEGFSASELRSAIGLSTRSRLEERIESAGEPSRASSSGRDRPSDVADSLYDRIFAERAEPLGRRAPAPASRPLANRIRNDRSLSPRRGARRDNRDSSDGSASWRRRQGLQEDTPPAAPQPVVSAAVSDQWPRDPPRRSIIDDDRWAPVQVRWPGNRVDPVTGSVADELDRISPREGTRLLTGLPVSSTRGRLLLPPASALRLWWWSEQVNVTRTADFIPWAVARGIRFIWGAEGAVVANPPDPLSGRPAPAELAWFDWLRTAVEVLRRPNARAFIWDGGIAWRLAIHFRRDLLNHIREGPSLVGAAAPLSYHWPDSFVVDAVSSAELNVLIGRRRDGLSWWPHPDIWDAALGIGEWWSTHETWFASRMAGILAGELTPLSDSAWFGNIRNWMSSTARPIMRAGTLRRVPLLIQVTNDAVFIEELVDGFVSLTLDSPPATGDEDEG